MLFSYMFGKFPFTLRIVLNKKLERHKPEFREMCQALLQ